jgi:WD40 repeat protein
VWDAGTLQRLDSLRQPERITTLACAPDNQTLCTGSSDGSARLWEPRSGEPRVMPVPSPGSMAYLWTIVFSPDKKHILVGSKDRTAWLMD